MAKYRHRIFEMYDSRDEATHALTPKAERRATEATAPETWVFKHLAVSRSAGVTRVEFTDTKTFGDENVSELAEDFARLANLLDRDNKVLVDFTGVESLSPEFIDALIVFYDKLRTKGSRLALCSLEPGARQSFFVAR